MNNGNYSNQNSTRLTLLDIHHPEFRKGYYHGRKHIFEEQSILTDLQFVDCLQSIFQDSEQENIAPVDEAVYYAVGGFVGQMSAGVIPRQPDEDNTLGRQEVFLAKVTRQYGALGQALTDTIRQFWAIQDQLAQTLDADSFEQMLYRGAEAERQQVR